MEFNPFRYEAEDLRATLRYTTDRRKEKRLRERIDQLERQATIHDQQQKKRNESKPTPVDNRQ